MTTAHTPGPWFAADVRTHGADPKMNGCDIGADNGANVGLALHQASDRSKAETVANARLIASAPDLLEALEEVVEFFSSCAGGSERNREDALRMAISAIAKATPPATVA